VRSDAVIVKRSFDRVDPDTDAIVFREFEALQIVRKHLPPQLLSTVPKPLTVLSSSRALVLEGLSGKPLNVILKHEANRLIGVLRRRRMHHLGQLVGQWLRQLHQATRLEPLPHHSANFLALLEECLGRCRTVGLARDEVDTIRHWLGEASHSIEGQPMPSAARQGDFIPQNILVDGNRVRVVDFENFCRCDSVYQDIATFVTYVQALSAFAFYSHGALRDLTEGFFQAYGVTGNEFPFRLYLTRSFVRLISELDMTQRLFYGQHRLRLLQRQLYAACSELRRG
jgi:hypothetical protein